LDKKISLKPAEIVKTVTILSHAKSFYTNSVKSTATTAYVLKYVLPHIEKIEEVLLVTGKPEHAAQVIKLLQIIAQILPFTESIENPKTAMDQVYKALMTVLPLPPASGAPAWETEDASNNLQFSRVECLLYALQQLIKFNTENFFSDESTLKDLRNRLTYFSRWSQAYQKVLREAIAGKKGEELKTEESKTKLMALKTTANINAIVKDFFHSPPACKSTITLSWVLEPEAIVAQKRPEMFDEKLPKAKQARKIYAPPSGKFSGKGSGSGSFRGGRGRGRGRGSFRRY